MTVLSHTRRAPGVYFDVEEPAGDELPRMDIAGFVGFACSGPLDLAVPVRGSAEFADIFGGEVALGTAEDGSEIRAHLSRAVHDFFSQGGERCYVVRVAQRDSSGPSAGRFALEGLFAFGNGELSGALIEARSEGSWADRLMVRTTAEVVPIRARLAPTSRRASRPVVYELVPRESLQREPSLEPGDVLRVVIDGWIGCFAVSYERGSGGRVLGTGFWFQRDRPPPIPIGSRGLLTLPSGVRVRARVDGSETDRASVSVEGAELDVGTPVVMAFAAGRRLLLSVTAVTPAGGRTSLEGNAAWLPAAAGAVPNVSDIDRLDRIRLSLAVRTGESGALRVLRDLGGHPIHTRALTALPSDRDLFGANEVDAHDALWRDSASPRFPLSGRHPYAAAVEMLLPIFVRREADAPEVWSRAFHDGRSAIARDGLERADASLFYDHRLFDPADPTRAATRRLRDGLGRATDPGVRWRGLHAFADVAELSLVAMPDAAQAVFDSVVEGVPGPGASEPSNTFPTFARCGPRELEAPAIELSSAGDRALRISWFHAFARAEFTVEEAVGSSDADRTIVYAGPARETVLRGRAVGSYWYRVRAEFSGAIGAWSAWRAWHVASAPRRRAVSVPRNQLANAHAAITAFAALRGDVLAILSLPRAFDAEQARAHLEEVAQHFAAEPDPEIDPLSYAAAYHPWARIDAASAPLDGLAAGALALRARERGAWVAWANDPLAAAVALEPAHSAAERVALQALPINLFAPSSRGILCLREGTLSGGDVRSVHVRRLLSLVRRTVLRAAQPFVFEPNGPALTSGLRGELEGALRRLAQHGAFSGAVERQRFQVDVRAGERAGAESRLLAELRIAPSAALELLRVRLVERSGELLAEGA